MATYREKGQRDFRLYANSSSKSSLDFNKIKIGRTSIQGDIAALIREEYGKKSAVKRYDRAAVEKAIETCNVKQLREISEYFYRISGIYSRLCRYMAFLYKYDWYVTPQRYDDKVKNDKVIEGWTKSLTYLENSNLKVVFGEIALKVLKNGSYYGLVMDRKDAAYLQELPANYCRSRYRVNGRYLVEFNIKYFDDAFQDVKYRNRVLKLFGKEFEKAYVSYKNGNLAKDFVGDDTGWFLLDSAKIKAVKFCLCDSDAPLFVSVIPAILDLEDAKDLDKDKMAQQLLRIIIQKLPIDKNGDLIFDIDEAQAMHNNAVGMVGDAIGVDVLTTFADVDVEDLSDNNNVSATDNLERVERTVFNEAGTSQLLFNSDGNIALTSSIANDEATMSNLVYQFADFLNLLLEPFNRNTKKLRYRAGILNTTIYNFKDIAKMYKEQAQLGYSKLMAQVAMGHTQLEIIATAQFENGIMKLNDLFTPPQMSSTMSGNKAATNNSGSSSTTKQTSGESTGGRPELPTEQKSEKTIQNIESSS